MKKNHQVAGQLVFLLNSLKVLFSMNRDSSLELPLKPFHQVISSSIIFLLHHLDVRVCHRQHTGHSQLNRLDGGENDEQ